MFKSRVPYTNEDKIMNWTDVPEMSQDMFDTFKMAIAGASNDEKFSRDTVLALLNEAERARRVIEEIQTQATFA